MIARSTLVVDGPLAIRMQRLATARKGNIGREILTVCTENSNPDVMMVKPTEDRV
jgi:hypothetical protein